MSDSPSRSACPAVSQGSHQDRRHRARHRRRDRAAADRVDQQGRRVLQARRRGDGEHRSLAGQEAAGARQWSWTSPSSRRRGRCCTASRSRAARPRRRATIMATLRGPGPRHVQERRRGRGQRDADRRQPGGRHPRRHHGQVPLQVQRRRAGQAEAAEAGRRRRPARSELTRCSGGPRPRRAGWRAATGRASPATQIRIVAAATPTISSGRICTGSSPMR